MAAPTELHRERVLTPGTTPAHWLLLTHGILGSGGNWRGIARRVVERRPTWGVVLVDQRGHGRSPAGAPPHTLAACAADVAAVMTVQAAAGEPIHALAGHSFGGKVVLTTRLLPAARDVVQTWVLDSSPGARPSGRPSVDVVVDTLERLPTEFVDRAAFESAMQAAGHTQAISQWLALSLLPAPFAGAPRRLRFDLGQIRALMADYVARDLWPAVDGPTVPGELHMVIGGRSELVTADDRARLAAASPSVHAHVLADAGHWLNADAPQAVIELLASTLPT